MGSSSTPGGARQGQTYQSPFHALTQLMARMPSQYQQPTQQAAPAAPAPQPQRDITGAARFMANNPDQFQGLQTGGLSPEQLYQRAHYIQSNPNQFNMSKGENGVYSIGQIPTPPPPQPIQNNNPFSLIERYTGPFVGMPGADMYRQWVNRPTQPQYMDDGPTLADMIRLPNGRMVNRQQYNRIMNPFGA